ncbi:hypothetical protein AX16_003725 [Volvariella volvacea WC 439]|nr:hypothetical protein AX16_003725 [Volvariella volvacea WC 439]
MASPVTAIGPSSAVPDPRKSRPPPPQPPQPPQQPPPLPATPLQPAPASSDPAMPLPPPKTPPEPPNLPLDISSFLAQPVAELTAEEKQELWTERIKLIADSVQARNAFNKLDDDLKELQRLQQAGRLYIQSPGELRKLDAQIADVEAQKAEKKKQMDETIAALSQSRYWPSIPPLSDGEGSKERYRSLVDAVERVRNTARQVFSLMNALREFPKHGEEMPTLDAMDVDEDESDTQPLKRKRLSETKSSSQDQDSSGLSAAEFDEIRQKIDELENQISNVENDLNAHEGDLAEEMEQQLQTKMEELLETAPVFNNSAADAERLHAAEEGITGINDTIDELAEETTVLMKRAQETELQVAALQQEIAASNERLVLMQQKMEGFAKARERHQIELATLSAALKAYIQHPPSPPSSPRIPPMEEVLEDIIDPVTQHLRDQVKEMLEAFRLEIEQVVQTHDAQMFPEISQKMAKVFRVMNALSDLMKRNNV